MKGALRHREGDPPTMTESDFTGVMLTHRGMCLGCGRLTRIARQLTAAGGVR
jgi:hypothetical protein